LYTFIARETVLRMIPRKTVFSHSDPYTSNMSWAFLYNPVTFSYINGPPPI